MEAPIRDYLTAHEVAERFRVSDRTVRRLVKRGELPGRYVGRQLRIPADAVDTPPATGKAA